MKRLKNGIILFLILNIFWVLMSNTYSLTVWLPGMIISLIITLVAVPGLQVFSEIRLTPKAFIYTVLYLFVFLKELILSNLDVAFRVVSPKLPINPGIVEAKTKLRSPMARMILANSITLTPGTFTVEISEDTLYIHCLNIKSGDIQNVTNKVIRKFEKYLEVIYG